MKILMDWGIMVFACSGSTTARYLQFHFKLAELRARTRDNVYTSLFPNYSAGTFRSCSAIYFTLWTGTKENLSSLEDVKTSLCLLCCPCFVCDMYLLSLQSTCTIPECFHFRLFASIYFNYCLFYLTPEGRKLWSYFSPIFITKTKRNTRWILVDVVWTTYTLRKLSLKYRNFSFAAAIYCVI